MNTRRVLSRVVALVAALFGVATLLAGGRVLAGSDPGYVVFRPLLFFNTAMGVVYLVAAVTIWLDPGPGRIWARGVFLVNLAVLVAILVLSSTGSAVAPDSLVAMTFRTVVWGLGFLVLSRLTAPGPREWKGMTR
jgi:hypothetical protein